VEVAFVFPSTHHMLRGEELLKRRGFSLRLVPAPPQAGEVCATAIAVPRSEREEAERCLREERIQVKAVLPRESRFERSLAKAAERVASGRGLPPPLSEALVALGAGERLEAGSIAGMLDAAESGEGEAVAAVAEEVTRDCFGSMVSALVGLRADGETAGGVPWRGLEGLAGEMRERGLAHLLLDLGGMENLPWTAAELEKAAGMGIVVIVAATSLTSGWGELVRKGLVRQLLLQNGEALSLSPAELAQEIVFLRDSRPGPVGSGKLVPLLDGRLEAAGAAGKRRVRGVIAVCRLVLGDIFLPIPPTLWREGGLGGANMPVIDATGRPLAEAAEEAEARLKESGLSFAKMGRRGEGDGRPAGESGADGDAGG